MMLINIVFCVRRTSSPCNNSALNAVIDNAKRFLDYEIIKQPVNRRRIVFWKSYTMYSSAVCA